MIFVPLPLLATVLLVLILARFIAARDMAVPQHRLFACMLGLYCIQSFLLCMRWGYEVKSAAAIIALLAPVLPALAFLAFQQLSGDQAKLRNRALITIVLNWSVYVFLTDFADPLILMTYLGFGILILRQATRGPDQLALSPIGDTRNIISAMKQTGIALIASGLTDAFIIYDFIRNDGQNTGLVITFFQSGFMIAISVSAAFGRSASNVEVEIEESPTPPSPSKEDTEIATQIKDLFAREGLHKSEELSLRKISRRLGVPDRQVSNAINRIWGVSVSQFVNQQRISEACHLLETTDDSILDISLASGFATKSNFNREFLRVTGKNPSNWRKRVEQI